MNNKDTPILVSMDNGGKKFVIYRGTRKKKTINVFKLFVNITLSALLYIAESIFMGMKGLKR